MMRRLLASLLLAASVLVAGGGLWRAATEEPPADRARQVQEVAATLRCPTCQGQSVATSPSEIAEGMRQIIQRQLDAGRSPDEIRVWFVQRYGDWVLLAPPRRGSTWLVWLLPAVFVLAGAAVAVRFARRAPPRAEPPVEASEQPRGRRYGPALAGTAVFLALTGAFLVASLQTRGPGDLPTGSPQGQTTVGRQDNPRDSQKVDIDELRAATRKHPDEPRSWIALGRALDARGDLVGAYEAYRKAADLAPQAREAQLLLASALLRGGSAGEAATIAGRLVKQRPNDTETLLILGLAQRRDDDPAARATLKRYLRLAPNAPASDIVRVLLGDKP